MNKALKIRMSQEDTNSFAVHFHSGGKLTSHFTLEIKIDLSLATQYFDFFQQLFVNFSYIKLSDVVKHIQKLVTLFTNQFGIKSIEYLSFSSCLIPLVKIIEQPVCLIRRLELSFGMSLISFSQENFLQFKKQFPLLEYLELNELRPENVLELILQYDYKLSIKTSNFYVSIVQMEVAP